MTEYARKRYQGKIEVAREITQMILREHRDFGAIPPGDWAWKEIFALEVAIQAQIFNSLIVEEAVYDASRDSNQ